MNTFPKFSDLLSHYLTQRDRSPAWLARRLDLHPGTVSRWLNQHTRPATPELVIRVADVLSVHTPTERQALMLAAGFAYVEDGTTPATASVPTSTPAQAKQPQSRLPLAQTSFVGRDRELEQIAERLTDPLARLVTIVGLGGMGKSRLAVVAASQLVDHFTDGVCFVALAPVTNATLIPAALTAALDLPIQGASDLEALVIRYLSDKRLLLILDNLEHLPTAAPLIERLLAGAPNVKVLATSRVRLRLDQEWLLPLDGLTMPPPHDLSYQTPADYTAADLFVQRAKRLQPDFALSRTTADDVIRICQLVGGMPLAIEMATAWLRVLPLAEIANEIQANLDFLVTSTSHESQRYGNMRAVFDHSWSLLDDKARHTLMGVSVFRGGFARHAAEAVAGADLLTLAELVDSSWLQLSAQGRYEIHELARQYAAEKLAAKIDGEADRAAQVHMAHAAYYAALTDGTVGYRGEMTQNISDLNVLTLELDNISTGWHWAAANRHFDKINQYAPALAWLADARGLYDEVTQEFEHVCALARATLAGGAVSQAPPQTSSKTPQHEVALTLAWLLLELCYLYGRSISVELGLARGAESLELLRQIGVDGSNGEDLTVYCAALLRMSLVTAKYADYQQARQCCEEVIHHTREKAAHLDVYCRALNSLSQIAYFQGNFAEAESLLLEYQTKTPDDGIRNVGQVRLAQVYMDMGEIVRAIRFADSALILAEQFGNRPSFAAALLTRAEINMAQGHFDDVTHYLDQVHLIAAETGNQYVQVRLLNSQAMFSRLLARPAEAEEFYRQAYALANSMARKKDAALAQIGLGFAFLDQEELEDAELCFQAGLRATWEPRIMPEALWAIVGLAALAGYAGQPEHAEEWLRCAVTHPACPNHVQVEAAAIGERFALTVIVQMLDEGDYQDPDTSLESVMHELLA